MKMIPSQAVLTLDHPNKNGRVYSTEAMERAVAKWQESGKDCLGGLTPEVPVSLEHVSHKIENLRIEDGKMIGDITVLNTPHGTMLQELYEDGVAIAYRPFGTGQLRKNGDVTEIYDYELIGISAMPEDQAA